MSHESLVMESGTHSSLHPNYYHQITYAKFSFKIHYLQPYKPKIWHHDQVSADHVRKEVDLFPWEKSLRNFNISNVTFLFNTTVKNIFSNCIPHETVTFDDRHHPWINKKVEQLIREKNEMYKKYAKEYKDPKIFDKVKCPQNELNSIIKSNKQKYSSHLPNKLIDLMTSLIVYWSP